MARHMAMVYKPGAFQGLGWFHANRGRKLVLEVKVFGSLGFHRNNTWVSLRDKHVGMPRLSKGLRADVEGSSVYPGLVPTFTDGQWGKGVEISACYGLRGCTEV